MSCPRKRFPASTASSKPIDNEAVRATNERLAEMMAERERQDKAAAFTQDKAAAAATAFTEKSSCDDLSSTKTKSTDR